MAFAGFGEDGADAAQNRDDECNEERNFNPNWLETATKRKIICVLVDFQTFFFVDLVAVDCPCVGEYAFAD